MRKVTLTSDDSILYCDEVFSILNTFDKVFSI